MTSTEQHLHSSFFEPLLDLAHERVGAERTEAALREAGTSEAELRDGTAWVSMALAEAVVEVLVRESGDDDLAVEAGRRMFTGPYLGILKALVSVGGSPRQMFGQFSNLGPRFNKAGQWTVAAVDETTAALEYRSDVERSVQMCRGRASQLAAATVIFGLPPAEVSHPRCLHRGDDCCDYRITWEAPRRDLGFWVAAMAAGALALAALGAASGASPLAVVALGGVGTLSGAVTALARRLTRQIEDQGRWMLRHDDALRRSMIASEQRYEELLAAKRDVDRRVTERTAELREASDQLARALEEVRGLDELKTRFFANVSHELRTPLQLILGPLEELGRGAVPAGALPDRVRVMTRNARRLHRLIDQILDLAKADAGEARVQPVAVRLSELAAGIGEAFAAQARASGVELVVQTGQDAVADLDPHWLESALTNLVANAIRHCAAGDRVTVRVGAEDGAVVVEVEDTGPGIPAADLPHLFERFVQSVQREGAARGTGLGLAIVQEAARLHGGTATVRSTLGVGTTFRIEVPHELPSDAETRPTRIVVEDAGVSEVAAVTEHPGPHAEAPLAVVAEDEPDLRAWVAETLSKRLRVIACADGAMALDQIRARLPDIVVSDRTMPQLTGTDLCEALRGAPETAGIPVILLTAHQSADDIVAGYDAGANDYVTKPFHPRELLARVEVQLRLQRMTREATVRERMASIGMLAAEIAHHFRNPLNFLRSGLPLVERNVDPDWLADKRRFWDTLIESTTRIELLTRDLLHLARGHEHAERRHFDPSESLRSAVRMIGATLPSDVRLEADTIEHGNVFGRTGDLNQVVLNLLDNAGRAVQAHGTLRLGARCVADRYVITIEDSGPGIPDSLQEHLFDAFVSTRAHGEGSGLGLAIAARMVSEHGGTIEAGRSEALGGACFRIALPLVTGSHHVGDAVGDDDDGHGEERAEEEIAEPFHV